MFSLPRKINNIKMLSIPKIFHQIWLGGDLPSLFEKYQATWIKFNPNWKLKLWNENNIKDLHYLNSDIFFALPNLVEKSDYLRILILLEFGGLYIDTDFECYKNIEPLLENCSFCIGEQFYGEYNNAFIGSIPNHPILQLAAKNITGQIKKIYMVSEDKTGPRFISKIINGNKETDTKIVPGFLLYPEYWLHIIEARENKTKIFASHHYNALHLEKPGIYTKVMILKQKISQFVLGKWLIIIIHILIRAMRKIEYFILKFGGINKRI